VSDEQILETIQRQREQALERQQRMKIQKLENELWLMTIQTKAWERLNRLRYDHVPC
jgi:hypothetical protein